MSNFGAFSNESLRLYEEMVSLGWDTDFSESEGFYDFTRCVRADGTYYGTRGKCKQGKEVAAREKPATRAEMQKINEKEAKRIAKARAKTPKLKSFSHDSLAKYNMTPEQEAKLKRSTYFKQVAKRLSEIKGELKVARNRREVKELTERHNSLVEAAENQIRKVKLEG